MQLVMQFGIILAVSFAGEALHALLPLPIPASVWGLCLMLALLMSGVLKPDRIRRAATFLIELMPLMFVPATAGVMESWGLLKPMLVPYLLAITLITAVVMGVTALTVQRLEGRMEHDRLPE